MSLKQLAALVSLAAIWGASYIFIRVAVEPVGPLLLMFIRVALSAVILLAYARLRRIELDIRQRWRQFLALGFFASALPFSLIAWAELTVTASMAAILMSTTPLFTALVAAVGLGEPLTRQKLIGALLGILGVTLTVGGGALELDADVLAATLALLMATLSYALGAVFAKRSFAGVNSMSLSTGQLLGSSFILAPVSLFDLPAHEVSSVALLAVLALVLLCTALAYQLYYYLIISAGPIQALTVTLLIPIFGVIWGGAASAGEYQPGHDRRPAACPVQRRFGDGDAIAAIAPAGQIQTLLSRARKPERRLRRDLARLQAMLPRSRSGSVRAATCSRRRSRDLV